MANTLKFGSGQWATKKGSTLAYNDENGNFKPLPFNFERSTSATRVNKQGLIEVVSNNEPRIDFTNDSKGALLLEPSRSNLITYSEDIESWATSGTITKTNNVHISPDGTQNAGTITSSASGFDRITQTISVSSNSTYTSSLFIKKEQTQTNYMGIGFIFTGGTTDVGYVIFDAINGVAVSADARIDVISEVKDFGDYWQLISTATDNGNNISLQFNIYATLSTNGITTGLGVSSPRTIWGIQLEQGSYATSYIPTQGSIGTRDIESCSDAGNDQVINSTEGVFYLNVASNGLNPSFDIITLSDGTPNNRVLFDYTSSDNQIELYLTVGGVNILGSTPFVTDDEDFIKVAIKWKDNDCSLWLNGVKINSTSNATVYPANTLDRLNFDIGTGTNSFYGKCKDLRVYNQALTDAELQALTQI